MIASYKGEVDGLKHELAMTKHQLDQLRYGLSPTEIESLTKNRGGERRKRVSRTFPTSLCEGCAPEAAERSPPPVS